MLCRVHLVPIRGGLLALPRLEVAAERRGDQDSRDVSVFVLFFFFDETLLTFFSFLYSR